MTENEKSAKAIIVREPQDIVVAPNSALTLWKGAKRALPVVGTAAIVWAGRKAANALLRWSQDKSIHIPELSQTRPQLEQHTQPEIPRNVQISYSYSAVRWTVHVRPSSSDSPDDRASD